MVSLKVPDPPSSPPASDETPPKKERVFLCLVDESEEFDTALRYACLRSLNTDGRVALVYAIASAEFQHWLGVGSIMERESREKAEERCNMMAALVKKRTGKVPIIYIREGAPETVLGEIIEEEAIFSVLVLGASVSGGGPGPVVTHMINQASHHFSLPIVIVPGSMTDEEIDGVT